MVYYLLLFYQHYNITYYIYIYILYNVCIYIYTYVCIYIYIQAFLGGLDLVDPLTGAAINLRGGQGVHQYLRERVRRPKGCEVSKFLLGCEVVKLLGTEVVQQGCSIPQTNSYFGEEKEVSRTPVDSPNCPSLTPGVLGALRLFSIKLLPFPGGEEDRCVSARVLV